MADRNDQDAIHKLISHLKKGEAHEARGVLSDFDGRSGKTRKRMLFEICRADIDIGAPLLANLLGRHEKLLKGSPVVEEMLASGLTERPDLLPEWIRGADDPREKAVFFRLAGENRLRETVPALMKILSDAEEIEIIMLSLTALGDIGDPAAAGVMADYLYSDQRDLVILAARALGQMADPGVTHRLAERMGTDVELDKVILEAFSNVRDATSLRKLNETLRSRNAVLRNFAKTALIRIGSDALGLLAENLLSDDPDRRIHSLNVLGEIGDPAAVAPIRKLLNSDPGDSNVRFAAYEALSRLPLSHGAYALAGGLLDPEEQVRVAAAKAIDRNFNDILSAGVKNMVKIGDDDSRMIVETIIDARCDAIFLSLAPEEYFRAPALGRLARAHEDVRRHFENLLGRNGFHDLAGKIAAVKKEPERGIRVCVVDDSRMILGIYKKALHEIGCESILFEFPDSAIEWLQSETADILLTDLNMPKITGVELTERIRRKYTSRELPIIMVTTQNEARDNQAAFAAGVDEILFKPFTAEMLKEAMDKYVGRGRGKA